METDKKQNQHLFIDYGYRFGDEILEQALYGQYMYTHRVAESTSYFSTHKRVNTHIHGIYLLHSADAIKITIGMPIGKVKTMMERLFRKGGNSNKKLLNLNTADFMHL